jgi:hypothetical protein
MQTSWKHSLNEARALFHNCRTTELVCERRDGARQQLVGGPSDASLLVASFSWQSFSPSALRAIEAVDAELATVQALVSKVSCERVGASVP